MTQRGQGDSSIVTWPRPHFFGLGEEKRMSRFPSRSQRRAKRAEAAKIASAQIAAKGNASVEVVVQGDDLVVRPKPVVED